MSVQFPLNHEGRISRGLRVASHQDFESLEQRVVKLETNSHPLQPVVNPQEFDQLLIKVTKLEKEKTKRASTKTNNPTR